jgi:hypothetical protein
MPRIRREDYDDLNFDDLDAQEYSTETFDTYDGEVPPKDIELSGYVRKMWWTRTSQNNDPMLKILWVAAENDGDFEEYNGCTFWLNYPLTGGAKFRWAPFMENYGLKLKDVKTIDLADADDQNGAPINKIGNLRPGENNDEAWARVVTDRERYNGEWKPSIKEWLPWEEADEEPEDEEEIDEEEEVEEEEPEPEPEPTRGRRSATPSRAARSAPEKPAATARGTRARAAAPAPEKPAPARGARGTRTAAKPTTAPARGRRSARGGGSAEDPPF